ncbi:hypothetical protein [Streptomyces sp. TRM70350]|uniref:hypothetical protein n=1 Tax=Streptomyces sp. TRM70350 TaxID=2856165 RepID=UPI001C44020C|nr:hypothetical protein [Streptomyces sp. TRM70350]MBV7698095.1 hypothetical protein [Streptomyces sp. TRM70350]
MAWDEWEQLKSDALQRRQDSAQMQLNSVDAGSGGTYGPFVVPSQFGVLKASQKDLATIGKSAHTLYNELWDKARVAVVGSDSAAADLSKQGFALGAGLQHVSTRWEEQLKSLMDACAHIANHMHVTKNVHAGDDDYIARQTSSIAVLDAGFDERVGAPGEPNSVYGEQSKKKE